MELASFRAELAELARFGEHNSNIRLLVCRAHFLRPETQMLNVKMLILAAPVWARISPEEAKFAEKSADFRRI
jgi:hypothetical protein